MASMDYCKFENTYSDLVKCLGAIEDRDISSKTEKEYARRILEQVCVFLQDEGIIENYEDEKIQAIIKEYRER